MTPYNEILSRPIAAYNVYTFGPEARESFFRLFKTDDVKSFEFFRALHDYSCRYNNGRWPDILDRKVLESMGKGGQNIERLQLYAEGYIVDYPRWPGSYLITHELIVFAYMACPDGGFIPISTGHIDFTQEEKIARFLRDQMSVPEPQVVTFLTKLVVLLSTKKRGTLLDEEWSIDLVFEIAKEHNIIADLCIELAEALNFIAFNIEERTMVCNALILVTYAASPRLD